MPMYEYACQQCEHSFETLVLGSEEIECPECHGQELERLFSVPAKPRGESSASLPMSCNSVGPPCGPRCGRFADN